jgi:hypothetical protein
MQLFTNRVLTSLLLLECLQHQGGSSATGLQQQPDFFCAHIEPPFQAPTSNERSGLGRNRPRFLFPHIHRLFRETIELFGVAV